jgi:hypothetical protein
MTDPRGTTTFAFSYSQLISYMEFVRGKTKNHSFDATPFFEM